MQKRLSLALLLIVFSFCATAQNLLLNPTFAEKDSCPQNADDMYLCKYWRSPTKSTPGYYSSCYDTTGKGTGPGVPQNWWAYQHSYSNSYAGIFGLQYGGYREYIATTFPPLIAGKTYRVGIWVSKADSATNASAGLGVFFYKDATPDYHTYGRIPVTPQVDYTGYGIITNDKEWVPLVATFVADSAYDNLVIGNFRHDTDVVTMSVITKPGKPLDYYLIDSVAVELIEETGVNSQRSSITYISVTPNPARDRYTFSFGEISDYKLTIYNSLGVAVMEKEHITGKDVTIERGTLPAGNYFYTAESGGNIAGKGRILLE